MSGTLQTLHFSQQIAAPRATVWKLMLSDAGYRDWTSAFCEGSYYEGRWAMGAELRFLSPGGQGMLSRVVEYREEERVCLSHQAEIENFEVKGPAVWQNALEDYRLVDEAGGTRIEVSTQITPEYGPMMQAVWPKALLRLQQLCEQA